MSIKINLSRLYGKDGQNLQMTKDEFKLSGHKTFTFINLSIDTKDIDYKIVNKDETFMIIDIENSRGRDIDYVARETGHAGSFDIDGRKHGIKIGWHWEIRIRCDKFRMITLLTVNENSDLKIFEKNDKLNITFKTENFPF